MPAKPKGKPGRKPKHTDVLALEKLLDRYFSEHDGKDGKPPTLNGLARALGYCETAIIWENIENNAIIRQSLKKAVTKVTEYYETCLTSKTTAAGAIFWLKNRGWRDIQEVKVDSEQARAITEAQEQAARALAERQIIGLSPGSAGLPAIDFVEQVQGDHVQDDPGETGA